MSCYGKEALSLLFSKIPLSELYRPYIKNMTTDKLFASIRILLFKVFESILLGMEVPDNRHVDMGERSTKDGFYSDKTK